MSTLSNVQQALLEADLMQTHWIDGGYEALSVQLEEELRKENEIVSIFSLVDQTEPDIKIRVRIILYNWIYCVPLEDVSGVVDINKVLHIEKEDLYFNWKDNIVERVCFSKFLPDTGKEVVDHKGVRWSKTEYIDSLKDIRVIYQRHN